MRERTFFPGRKRDVALIHEDGFYLDSVPKKIGGPEKVGQMCAIILVYRFNLERRIKEITNYDLIPLVVAQLVQATKEVFENTAEHPDENLRDLVVEKLTLFQKSRVLEIRLGVYTEAGDYTPLHLRIPLYEGDVKIKI